MTMNKPTDDLAGPLHRVVLTGRQREAIMYCIACAQDFRDTIDSFEPDGDLARQKATENIDIAIRLVWPLVGP
jgi:hypothetical protein